MSAVALFCEDIREEKSGAETFVGVFSDNISMPPGANGFSKLAIYLRMILPTDEPPEEINAVLKRPEGEQDFQLASFTYRFVEDAFNDAKKRGSPIAGLIARGFFVPFPVPNAGRFLVVVKTPTIEMIAGTLNVQFQTSASPPPSSQSQPAVS